MKKADYIMLVMRYEDELIVGRVWLDAFELELIDCPRRSSEAEAEDDDVEPWPQAPRAPHFPRILRIA